MSISTKMNRLEHVLTCNDLEWPKLHIALNGRVGESAADEPLGVKNGVLRIHRDLILGRIADKPFGIGESHIGGRSSVALVVGNNLNPIVLPNADAAVSGAEINANAFAFALGSH